MIIDVDAHIWEPLSWLHQTDPELLEALGPVAGGLDLFVGELMSRLPPEQAERFRSQTESNLVLSVFGQGGRSMEQLQERIDGLVAEGSQDVVLRSMQAEGVWNPDERVAVNAAQGIDLQVLNPGLAMGVKTNVLKEHPELFGRYTRAYNSWIIDTYAGYTDRLLPTALIDFQDPQAAARELRRVREQGIRTYVHPMQPVGGKPPSHPDHDVIWATTAELGMLPLVHVGNPGPVVDPQWFNTGRPDQDGPVMWRMAMLMSSTVPQLVIGDMLFNGVFDRFPDLTLLCCEQGLEWFLGFWSKLGAAFDSAMGWPYALSPQDTVRRNVRLSGLPSGWLSEAYLPDPVAWFMGEFDTSMLWFASDYPHPEGNPEAIAEFTRALEPFDEDVRSSFFGGGAATVLTR